MLLDRHHQVELAIVATIVLLALAQPVDAWYCDGERQCDNSAYKGCCLTYSGNVIPVCVPQEYDCSENCCVGSGCNSWDDFWFCDEGRIANCDTTSSNTHGMVCCSDDYPVYSNVADSCWKSDWDCTNDVHCETDEVCTLNKCVDMVCGANYKECAGDFVVERGYDATNHACNLVEISRYECRINEYCSAGKCEILQCDDVYWACDDYIRVEMGYFTEGHACVLKETGDKTECGIYESCLDGECFEIPCNDNDNCTTDTIVNRVCVNTFNDADSDSFCDFIDACPYEFGSGIDGCPYGDEVWDIILEDYGIFIVLGAIASVITAIIVIYIIIIRRRPEVRYRW